MKKYNYKILTLIILFIVFSLIYLKNLGITGRALEENNNNLKIEIPKSYSEVYPGSKILFTTRLLNFENNGRRDVTLECSLLDSNDHTILKKSETLAIETQASFVGDILIPSDTKEGVYYIRVVLVESKDKISSKEPFKVVKEKESNMSFYSLTIISIIFLLAIIKFTGSIKENIYLRLNIRKIIKEYYKENN